MIEADRHVSGVDRRIDLLVAPLVRGGGQRGYARQAHRLDHATTIEGYTLPPLACPHGFAQAFTSSSRILAAAPAGLSTYTSVTVPGSVGQVNVADCPGASCPVVP